MPTDEYGGKHHRDGHRIYPKKDILLAIGTGAPAKQKQQKTRRVKNTKGNT